MFCSSTACAIILFRMMQADALNNIMRTHIIYDASEYASYFGSKQNSARRQSREMCEKLQFFPRTLDFIVEKNLTIIEQIWLGPTAM